LVPQPAQARRRYRKDRRRIRAESCSLCRRSRFRADADRSGAPAGNQDRRRMGSGRAIGVDFARLGLRLHTGALDRPCLVRTAVESCDGRGSSGGGLRFKSGAARAREEPWPLLFQHQVSPPAKMSFLMTAWTPQFPSTTWVIPKSTPIVIREIASSSVSFLVVIRNLRILRNASRKARSTNDFE